jgi:hypothetical protein
MVFHRNGMKPLRVVLELRGDFCEDIQGKIIRLSNPNPSDKNERLGKEGSYMEGFSPVQRGEAGDITAGVPLGLDDSGRTRFAYSPYPYFEWFAANGRVVLELDPSQVEIVEGATVLKVPPSGCQYQTEEDMIQSLRPLLERSIRSARDEPEVP